MLVPRPRRNPSDPRGLQLFVHLARIAAATADVDGPVREGLRHDLHLLELESARERPRHQVELALVDEVVTGLAGVVSASTRALLADARDDVRRPHPDLRPVDRLGGLGGPAGVSAVG